jgi:hypothetical protein
MIRRTRVPFPTFLLVEIVPGAALIAVGGHNCDLPYLAAAAQAFLGALTIVPIRKVT